jgi:hypothetical protein
MNEQKMKVLLPLIHFNCMKCRIKNGLRFVLLFSCICIASCQKQKTLFISLPEAETHVKFSNKLKDKPGFGILYYLYFYNGGGVSTGDINNDGLPDIYFTSNTKSGNKLYLNKGDFKFEDITGKAGVAGTADWSTGVTMADVNADGLLDIYVSTVSNRFGLKGHNELFINKGNSTFSEESEKYGLNTSCLSTQAVFFDYDHDGDLDCFILNQSHNPHSNIADTGKRRIYDSLSGDRFYRNDIATAGKFTDISAATGIYQSSLGYGLGIAVADMNNDGWDDIYVGNDFHENDYYYINNGNGSFTESGAGHFKHYSRFSMGNDIADYNNDGQMDLVTVDMLPREEKILKTYGSDENPDIYKFKLDANGYQKQYSKNCLQRNNGNGSSFSDVSLISGVSATDWSWSPLFADFDNDGRKDLFVSSGIVKRPVDLDYIRFVSDLDVKKGRQQTDKYDEMAIEHMPDGAGHPYFFKNEGGLNFKDISMDWGTGKMNGYFTGASYADLDNDGNLDVVINAINSPAMILRNTAPEKKAMNISFKGNNLNTFGIGVKAWLFANGKMQYQQLMLTRGFQSSCEARLHFGLDTLKHIDSLLIVWPDQKFQILRNFPINSRLELKQEDASGIFQYSTYFPPAKKLYEDITSQMQCNWAHIENDFFDFNKQYLIPHQLSTRGPKIAVADINKDGLEDFYVCGASMQPGALMIQTKDGKFKENALVVSSRMKATEETDAVFFDANNDGWPDLYITSGGNEYDNENPALNDNLFINDGRGKLVQVLNTFPKLLINKSCVISSDVDKDGDMDLFVGGLSDARQYGIPQPSCLLLNDGIGNFSKAGPAIIKLDSLGMVTSASFADINKDGWPDLVVTGEWMPLKIFINNKGIFKEMDIPQSAGLWQTLYTADINGDGYTDILAGNWGHNTKFWSGKNGPLKLYVKDFDRNGSVEQVLAYTIDGKEYNFLCKDELERALPVLKKAYLTYSEVAGKTVQYLFDDLFKNYVELKAETLATSCFLNDGKGNFVRKDLPDELQLAPVFSFASLTVKGSNNFIAGGNFYGVIPYEGRYDALLPTAFNYNKVSGGFDLTPNLPLADGEIRDIKCLKTTNGKKIMVVAANNNRLKFFRIAE